MFLSNRKSFHLSFVQNKKWIIISLLIFLFLALLISVSFGAYSINWLKLFSRNAQSYEYTVLMSIRLPRVLLACFVGAGLAVSGAVLQGLFRNPLADPALIGVSAGAALGVAISIVILGINSGLLGIYIFSISGFLGGLIASFLIFEFAKKSEQKLFMTNILLAGIAMNAIAGAMTGLLLFLSNDQQLRSLVFWTMGGLGGALWSQVLICGIIVLPLTYLMMRKGHLINIFMLGDEQAQFLGVETKKLKRHLLLFAALNIGLCVSVSGIIGFVGLIVPHLVRLILGADHRILIPVSALLGAILLCFADLFSRIIIQPSELPIGIVTSLIGGPFFIWLLIQKPFER